MSAAGRLPRILSETSIHCPTTVPQELLTAFAAYEQALMADDTAAMDALFAPGPQTLRGDPGGLLAGHDTIHDFRAVRGGAPPRTIVELHVQLLAVNAAVLVAVTSVPNGGRGLQTQVWQRSEFYPGPGGWAVIAAQVAPPPVSFDRTVWRVVGDPLLPGGTAGPGDETPPLAGESVAVKDVFAVAGQRVGAGVPAWLAEAAVEPANAPALQRLVDAGALVRGIARTDQLAYSLAGDNPHYGTPVNPRVSGGLPGGSSSGSATAVALGAASIGLATDTAGSVRVPASYQGLWGLRTTHGSVPGEGVLPLAGDFDAVGLLTRSPDVLARAARVLTRGAVGTGLDRPRLVLADWPGVTQEVADVFAGWAAGRGPLGRIELGDLAEAAEAFRVWQAWQAWDNHGDWLTAHPRALQGAAGQRFLLASRITADEAASARQSVASWRRQLDDLLGEDILVLPSAPSPAPRVWAQADDVDRLRAATMRLTCVAGITGRPAVGAPLLDTHDGPVGVCFVGPRGSDVALVDLAATV